MSFDGYLVVTGLALPSDVQANTQIRDDGGAKSGALGSDHNLDWVIEAWAELPEAIRAGIVAMVRASQEG